MRIIVTRSAGYDITCFACATNNDDGNGTGVMVTTANLSVVTRHQTASLDTHSSSLGVLQTSIAGFMKNNTGTTSNFTSIALKM